MGTTLSVDKFDWLDNEYVEVNVYDITNEWIPKISKDVKLRMCDRKKDLEKFMSPNVSKYYPNALCFDDKRTIKLESNWFASKYSSLYISMDQCQPRPGKTCASKEDITKFTRENIFYFIAQKTTVNKEKYDDLTDNHFTDENGYYPLEQQPKSLMYSALPDFGEGVIPMFEVMMGLDKI